jgi:TetR/AcrR family transcriptional regulator, tetracycline repressor protein
VTLLHRADVVDGAVELLDAEGLDGLTTRKLGASLNIDGSALYRHFPNKEALLDAIADRLVEGIDRSLPEGPWDEQLAVLAGRLRETLLAHRDGARVVAGTYVTGPNTLLVGNVIFEILQGAGFPPERAGWIVFALGYYVLGHTIEEQAQAGLAASRAWKTRLTEMVDRTDNAYIATAVTATFNADPAERFTYGLHAFLDGIRRELDQPAPATTKQTDGVKAATTTTMHAT